MEHTDHTQLRFSFMLPVAAFALVLGSLFATDRALRDSDAAGAKAEAMESAALLNAFFLAQMQALAPYHDAVAAGGSARDLASAFDGVLRKTSGFPPGIRRIWLTDSSGSIRMDSAEASNRRPSAPEAVSLADLPAAMAKARATGHATLSHAFRDSGGGIETVFVDPVAGRGGFVGAMIALDSILAIIADGPSGERRLIRITTGADSVDLGEIAWHGAGAARFRQPLSVESTRGWAVEVAKQGTSQALRALLWALALTALAAMLFSLAAERRQARRFAERSAGLERLSAEVLSANRAKSEFLANVSHELRTPLNAIVGFVDLLRDGGYGPLAPNQVGPVDRIASSATHLRTLVDQILDLARITAGRLDVHPDVIQLRPFVLNVLAEIESLLTARGLGVSVSISTTLPRIRTDPVHLRQIFLNLLGNAIKFTQDGGISVRGRLTGQPASSWLRSRASTRPDASNAWLAVQIVDTGIGIPEADLERIFGEFEQVNAGPRGNSIQRGTGLGLPISRRLARLLDGDITVESRLGEGSIFTLWLPIDSAELLAAQERRRMSSRDLGASEQRGTGPISGA